jgi:membrane protease YdiL (CAAX protease family)
MLLFNNFKEQEIVTKLKTDLSFTLLVSSIMIAPVIEEIFFRKFVYRIIKKKFGLFVGAIIVSLMFSVIHYNLYSFGTLFLLSIICTIKYENTGRVIYPILIHSFFNLTMVLFSLIK